MKKVISMLLALCLLSACCSAGAETVSGLRYEKNGFTADIPEGWVLGHEEDISTFYYAPVDGSTDNVMLMFMVYRDDSLIGIDLTEDELQKQYNDFIQELLPSAEDGNLSGGYITTAGKQAMICWLRHEIDGVMNSAAYVLVIIDGWRFLAALVHPALDAQALANYLFEICNTVQYDSAVGNAPEQTVSLEDLPTKENPYRFEPTITDRQNYLTAQWMVDGSTRALCTMTLSLDLDLSYSNSFTAAFPMNVFASYIGCEDDIIRTIVPSQDETIAYIFEYNPMERTALYYAEPWNEETLAAFEASCTDQYYANTEDALVYVAQLMMNSYNEAASE